jgi:hypothetical protein
VSTQSAERTDGIRRQVAGCSTGEPEMEGWPGRNAARMVLSAAGIDPATVMGG